MHINITSLVLSATDSLFNMTTAIAIAFYGVVVGLREMGNGI